MKNYENVPFKVFVRRGVQYTGTYYEKKISLSQGSTTLLKGFQKVNVLAVVGSELKDEHAMLTVLQHFCENIYLFNKNKK
jgi:hypothetical protein